LARKLTSKNKKILTSPITGEKVSKKTPKNIVELMVYRWDNGGSQGKSLRKKERRSAFGVQHMPRRWDQSGTALE
jgi:hypothetical protein